MPKVFFDDRFRLEVIGLVPDIGDGLCEKNFLNPHEGATTLAGPVNLTRGIAVVTKHRESFGKAWLRHAANGRELPFAISIGECPQHSEPRRVDPGDASCDSAGRRLV